MLADADDLVTNPTPRKKIGSIRKTLARLSRFAFGSEENVELGMQNLQRNKVDNFQDYGSNMSTPATSRESVIQFITPIKIYIYL